jgi:hypothetical protein
MTTVLDSPTTTSQEYSSATRLRLTTAGVRVHLRWFGVRKSLTAEQTSQAADRFGAEGAFLSACKKLIDTRDPAYKAVTSVKSRAISYWRSMSLPYTEPGLRLIRRDRVEEFDRRMQEFQGELEEAVARLDEHYAQLRASARERLGALYDPRDYPASLRGLFQMEHDFPSVEPPDYLQELNPTLYAQQCQRVRDRFDEAVQLAEEAFIHELGKLISHLTERLTGQVDGRPKIFRDSALGNLNEFFERFRELNVRSNDELDALVEEAQGICQGVAPQDLRDNRTLRRHVAAQLGHVQSALDDLLVDRPRRNLLRRPR